MLKKIKNMINKMFRRNKKNTVEKAIQIQHTTHDEMKKVEEKQKQQEAIRKEMQRKSIDRFKKALEKRRREHALKVASTPVMKSEPDVLVTLKNIVTEMKENAREIGKIGYMKKYDRLAVKISKAIKENPENKILKDIQRVNRKTKHIHLQKLIEIKKAAEKNLDPIKQLKKAIGTDEFQQKFEKVRKLPLSEKDKIKANIYSEANYLQKNGICFMNIYGEFEKINFSKDEIKKMVHDEKRLKSAGREMM